MIYKHRQAGFVTTSLFGIASLVLADLSLFHLVTPAPDAEPQLVRMVLYALLALTLFAAILFSSLTVTVDGARLIWHFSFGFGKRCLWLDEIASHTPVRNRWWYGFGIRRLSKGWLYNVSGLDAIELRLADNRCLRLGTDEPEKLDAALAVAKATPEAALDRLRPTVTTAGAAHRA